MSPQPSSGGCGCEREPRRVRVGEEERDEAAERARSGDEGRDRRGCMLVCCGLESTSALLRWAGRGGRGSGAGGDAGVAKTRGGERLVGECAGMSVRYSPVYASGTMQAGSARRERVEVRPTRRCCASLSSSSSSSSSPSLRFSALVAPFRAACTHPGFGPEQQEKRKLLRREPLDPPQLPRSRSQSSACSTVSLQPGSPSTYSHMTTAPPWPRRRPGPCPSRGSRAPRRAPRRGTPRCRARLRLRPGAG